MGRGRPRKENALDYEPETKFTDLINETPDGELVDLSELAKEKDESEEQDDTDIDFGYIEDDPEEDTNDDHN